MGKHLTGASSTVVFGTLAGAGGAALTGGNVWQGAATGAIVAGLNHVMHRMQEKSLLDKAIIKAGFDPDDVARWTNEELTVNISKIFPDLYEAADCPSFEILDVIGGKDNIYGQAQKIVTGRHGSYVVISKGLIYIKKLALNSIRHVATVAGHELNHVQDYVNGDYARWLNRFFDNFNSELKAYEWQLKMGTPETLFNREEYNRFKELTKNR